MKTLHLDGFDITGKIGRGAMATVYSAVEIAHGREVALKVLDDALAMDSVIVGRFMREAYISARLVHPNIARILDVREDDGTFFLVMELVRGRSLAEVLGETGQLQIHDALSIAMNIAYALDFAHGQGVVHRDVKPSNILIEALPGGESRLVVIDFGIAWAREVTQLTLAGEPIGTSFYMSPEQALGKVSDLRSDIYSLGVIMYQMLAGKVPFTAGNNQAVLYKQIHETPRPLSRLRPGLPRSLVAIVMKAMDKNPHRRHQSVSELFRALYTEWNRLEKRAGRRSAGSDTAAAAGAYSGALMTVLRNGRDELPEPEASGPLIAPYCQIEPEPGAGPVDEGVHRQVRERPAGCEAAQRASIERPKRKLVLEEQAIRKRLLRRERSSRQAGRTGRSETGTKRRAPIFRLTAFLISLTIVVGIVLLGCEKTFGALFAHAVEKNDTILAGYLADIRPDLIRGQRGGSLLLPASRSDRAGWIVRLLTDRGAAADVSDSSGDTPLHFCAGTGDTEAAGLLISKGAPVNRRNRSGETPLHRAAANGRCGAVRLLISNGADLTIKDAQGRTPLELALSSSGSKDSAETAAALLDGGAAADEPDSEGRTPLFLAALSGNPDAAKVLFERGASVNRRDREGRTVLHVAAESGNADMVRLVLEHISRGAR